MDSTNVLHQTTTPPTTPNRCPLRPWNLASRLRALVADASPRCASCLARWLPGAVRVDRRKLRRCPLVNMARGSNLAAARAAQGLPPALPCPARSPATPPARRDVAEVRLLEEPSPQTRVGLPRQPCRHRTVRGDRRQGVCLVGEGPFLPCEPPGGADRMSGGRHVPPTALIRSR